MIPCLFYLQHPIYVGIYEHLNSMHHSIGAMGTGAPCVFNEWQPSVRHAFEPDGTGFQSYVYIPNYFGTRIVLMRSFVITA